MTAVGDLLVEFKEKPGTKDEPPVLTLTERNGFVRQADRFNKRLATEDTSNYKVVRHNDIAFNPYLLWAGAVAQNTIVDKGIISPLYPTFRVRDGHDPRYVARLLLTPQLISSYDGIAFGSVPRRRRSSVNDFLALPLAAVPPLPEQRRIAAILDHADALRTKRRQVLTHLDSVIQATYFNMFEGKRWPSVPLVDLASSPNDIKCGPFGTQLNVSEFRSAGVPLLGIKNVNARFDLPPFEFLDIATAARLSPYDLRPGDLVMTRKGTIGNCAIYPASLPAGVMHSDLLRARFSPAAANVVFLEHHLQLSPRISHQIRMMSPGAVMPGINVTKLKQLAVDTPPIPLQHDFATRVGLIDQQRSLVRRAMSADDELFASLQSRAFRGEL